MILQPEPTLEQLTTTSKPSILSRRFYTCLQFRLNTAPLHSRTLASELSEADGKDVLTCVQVQLNVTD